MGFIEEIYLDVCVMKELWGMVNVIRARNVFSECKNE
jgi:hypothetical protein